MKYFSFPRLPFPPVREIPPSICEEDLSCTQSQRETRKARLLSRKTKAMQDDIETFLRAFNLRRYTYSPARDRCTVKKVLKKKYNLN